MTRNRLRVRTRIALGFGLLVALTLGVAGFGIYQVSGVGNQARLMTDMSVNMRRVLTIARLVEGLSGAETRYRAEPDAATLGLQQSSRAQAETLLKQSMAATASPAERGSYGAILALLKSHDDIFARYRQSASTAIDNRAALLSGGDQLTTDTEQLFTASSQASLPLWSPRSPSSSERSTATTTALAPNSSRNRQAARHTSVIRDILGRHYQ